MSKRDLMIAQGLKVAEDIRMHEDHIDAALRSSAMLVATMLDARAKMGLAAMHGQAELESIADGMAALAVARKFAITAHSGLDELRGRLPVLREVSYGDVGKWPEALTVELNDDNAQTIG